MSDRVLSGLAHGAGLIVVGLFSWLVWDVVRQGLPAVSIRYLLESPSDTGRAGGIAPMIVSTGLIVGVCILLSSPVGIAAGAFLSLVSRSDSIIARLIRSSIDILSAIPSIVFGLFGSIVFCEIFGLGFSILSGGMTLSCMVLPLLVRTTEQALRTVDSQHRESASALAMSDGAIFWGVLLPAAMPGIVVGMVLSVGRALAETAALIFTSGYVDRFPDSLLDSGRSLSVHVYDLGTNVPGGGRNAFAAAFVLVVALAGINTFVAWLLSRWRRSRGLA